MGLCALCWHWDPQHPFPASPVYPETPTSPSVSAPNEPKMSFVPEHPRGPGCSQKKKSLLPLSPSKPTLGCPQSPHPCHPITSHGCSPHSPLCVQGEPAPGGFTPPPSFPCRLFFSSSPPSIKQQICFQSNKTAVQPLEQMFSARLRAQGRRGDSH